MGAIKCQILSVFQSFLLDILQQHEYQPNVQHEYQPNVLPDQLIEINHEACPYRKTTKLLNCNERTKCQGEFWDIMFQIKTDILRNLLMFLFMFYLFQSEDELFTWNSLTY